jgi:hypothetical protein
VERKGLASRLQPILAQGVASTNRAPEEGLRQQEFPADIRHDSRFTL